MESTLEKIISLDFTIKGNGERWRCTEEHSSLVLDIQEQKFFWNSRNIFGGAKDYLTKVKSYSEKEAENLIQEISFVRANSLRSPKKGELVVPNEKLVEIFWKNGKTDRDYWYRRCLTDESIDRFRLGKYNGFYMLPIYLGNTFRNFQCRRDVPEKLIRQWYRGVGPLLFNANMLRIIDKVYITESPVDAILLNQLGFPAVSHVGGANGWRDSYFKYFCRIKEVFVVADNDKPGLSSAIQIAKSLGTNRTKIILFEGFPDKYDSIDFFREGHSTEEFNILIENSKHSYEIRKGQNK